MNGDQRWEVAQYKYLTTIVYLISFLAFSGTVFQGLVNANMACLLNFKGGSNMVLSEIIVYSAFTFIL